MSDPKSRSRRLVHLAKNHDRVFQDAGFLHFPIKFFSLSNPFSDPAKQADPFVTGHHIVDHFHDKDCFAHTGAAEKPAFTPQFHRREKIDGLNTCNKDFGLGGLAHQGHRRLVDGTPLSACNGFFPVNGFPENVEHPSQKSLSYRNL
jgi:hypothetical protein